ncbi:hypothetical protein [Hymenobacter agri]
MKRILQDIGESSALLQLSIRMLDKPDWRVFPNYMEAGCDLLLLRSTKDKFGHQIKIEVKTRQNVVTKNPLRPDIHFTLTESERNEADFLIAYWFDRNSFFIVPRSELRPAKSGNSTLYKFIASYSRSKNAFNERSNQFLNRWDLITDATDNY